MDSLEEGSEFISTVFKVLESKDEEIEALLFENNPLKKLTDFFKTQFTECSSLKKNRAGRRKYMFSKEQVSAIVVGAVEGDIDFLSNSARYKLNGLCKVAKLLVDYHTSPVVDQSAHTNIQMQIVATKNLFREHLYNEDVDLTTSPLYSLHQHFEALGKLRRFNRANGSATINVCANDFNVV